MTEPLARLAAPIDLLLLTRFNVKRRGRTASDPWLRERVRLFTRVCLPSVAAQTEPPTRWLVFFDGGSPDWLREVAHELGEGTFEPVWLPGEVPMSVYAEHVRRHSSGPWVATTRLDNDDALARDFVARTRAALRPTAEFLNFASGLQVTAEGTVHRLRDPSNAFLTRTERRAEATTVYAVRHPRAGEVAPVRQLEGPPMWLQHIHGDNLVNAVHGIRVSPTALDRFDVRIDVRPVGPVALAAARVIDVARVVRRLVLRPTRLRWAWRVLRSRLGSRPR
ncbi:MAG: glycosyltransferase [Nocardioides alkalitolerans]